MAEVNITSDLTAANTKVTVDGKAVKGEITRCSFQMYYSTPMNSDGSLGEPCPCCRLCVETEETMEDGTVKSVEYEYEKEGDGDMSMMDKVVDKTPSPNQIVDFLKKKMQGKF